MNDSDPTNKIIVQPLSTIDHLPISQNPAAVFIAQLKSENSKRSMKRYLNQMAQLLGVQPMYAEAVGERPKMGRRPKSEEITYLACPWADLRKQHTMAVVAKLSDVYAPATVNGMLSALRQVLYYAWDLGQMTAEDYRRAVNIQNITSSTLPVGRDISMGEMLALTNACTADVAANGRLKVAGIRDVAIIGVLYTCGLRRSEVANLELKHFEADAAKLSIIGGKGRKDRTVYLANGALEALNDWLAVRGDEAGALFMPVNKSDKIQRRAMTNQAIYNVLMKRGKEAGVKDFAAHDFRRTFAGDMLDRGVDIVTVQKMMGHADPKTTSRYDRRPERTKQDAANKLHFPYTKKGLG